MSSFLAGLLGDASRTDIEQWRAEIEHKRVLKAQQRARDEAAHTATPPKRSQHNRSDATRPKAPESPSIPAPTRVHNAEQILSLWHDGITDIDQIIAATSLSAATIRRHLRTSGITPPKPHHLPTQPIATTAPEPREQARSVGEPSARVIGPRALKAPPVRGAEQVITLWHDGITDIETIAARASLKPGTVRTHLRKAGITPPRPNQLRQQQMGDRIVELYASGHLGQLAIARQLGCSASTVARYLKLRNVQPLRSRGRRITKPTGSKPKEYSPELVERIRQLADEKVGGQLLTQAQIAERTGTSRKVVYNVMRRHQIAAGPAAARSPRDHAAALKERMHEAHVTTAQVRAWARASGLPIADRGLPTRALLEAYLKAHHGTPAA